MDLYEKIRYICGKVIACEKCPLLKLSAIYSDRCPLDKSYPSLWPSREEIEKIADKWFEEHPVKTRQSEFLRLFPNHPFNFNSDNGCIALCPKRIDTTFEPVDNHLCINDGCSICLPKYWSEEVE